MAYVQNTDNNGLVVCQGENVAGDGFTNVKVNAGNALYVSIQEIVAALEQATKGTVAHDAADTADAPVKMGGYAKAAAPTAVNADADIVNAWFDRYGRLSVWMDLYQGTPASAVPTAGLMAAISDGTNARFIKGDSAGVPFVQGEIAHDAADSGNPIKTGSKAVDITSLPADVTALDRADDISDLKGRKIVTMDEVMGTAGSAIPAKGVIAQGSDGTNARAIKTDSSGNVQVEALATPYDATIAAAVPATGAAVAISDGTNARLIKGDSAGVPFMQGEIAHDAADSGNPIKTGGTATAALPSAVTEGDRVQSSYDLYGQKRIIKQERSVTLHAAGAVTAGANDSAVVGVGPYTHAEFLFNLTAAATGAGDTLDVLVDASPDGGTTWVNVLHFTQCLGNGGAKKYVAAIHSAANLTDVDVTSDLAAGAAPRSFLGNALRCRYAVVDAGGGLQSFNFVLTAVLKQS